MLNLIKFMKSLSNSIYFKKKMKNKLLKIIFFRIKFYLHNQSIDNCFYYFFKKLFQVLCLKLDKNPAILSLLKITIKIITLHFNLHFIY